MLDPSNILPISAVLTGQVKVRHERRSFLFPSEAVLSSSPGTLVLNCAGITPGSVVLTRRAFDAGSKAVSALQSFVFDNEASSMWSHVAILDEDLSVWDIMPNEHVRHIEIGNFLEGADFFAIRSLRGFSNAEGELHSLIREQRFASYPNLLRRDYVRSFLSMMSGRRDFSVPPTSELICSTFVDRVLRIASGKEILPEDRPPLVLPGHFARSTEFVDVSLHDRVYCVVS